MITKMRPHWCIIAGLIASIALPHLADGAVPAPPLTSSHITIDTILDELQASGLQVTPVESKFPTTVFESFHAIHGQMRYDVTLFKCSDGTSVCKVGLDVRLSLPADTDVSDPDRYKSFVFNVVNMQAMIDAKVSVPKGAAGPAYIELNYGYPCEDFENAKFIRMLTAHFERDVGQFAGVFNMWQSIERARAPQNIGGPRLLEK